MQQIVSTEECTAVLKRIALDRLTSKQKIILEMAKQLEGDKVSDFVIKVKEKLQCSESIVWKSVKALKEIMLLSESSRISLTEIGKELLSGEEQ